MSGQLIIVYGTRLETTNNKNNEITKTEIDLDGFCVCSRYRPTSHAAAQTMNSLLYQLRFHSL